MKIPENVKVILGKLYSNKILGPDELQKLESWLRVAQSDQQAEAWLKANWKKAADMEINLTFDEIRQRIKQNGEHLRKRKLQHWKYKIQRIAAVLLIPVLLLTSWMIFQHYQDSSEWLALTTKQGERTHLVLPDGSEVWINVDSKLEYPTTFNQKSRSLKLQGEAYFKVAKGKRLPFAVKAGDFEVEAIGTEFNISAYPDDPNASTFLKEGIVKLNYSQNKGNRKSFEMKPGELAVIDPQKHAVKIEPSSNSYSDNWRNGELYFGNEPMNQVFRKMERWYSITIHYNPEEFTNETLVVHLKKGEPVERLLNIMDNAIGIVYHKSGNEYRIRKKQ